MNRLEIFMFSMIFLLENLNVDIDYYLFGEGRYVGVVIIIIALFLINFLHKYSFVITVTMAFLMSTLYLRQTPPLIWEAILVMLVGIILLLTGSLRMKH